jgi:ketosteroid isomerase-like protein
MFAQSFADAFSNRDVEGVLGMLAEDVEIFDHVPYRFDDRAQFGAYFAGAINPFESMSFAFRQPSCRVLDETVGIVNAYDSFTGLMKDGKVLVLHGRTTLVVGKRSGQWKIVSAHFSPLPHAS